MSQYDNIKTVKDMIREVNMHGLSNDQDDLNRVADIFGHSAVDTLAELANDRETQSKFYFIASHIWNWEDLTRFWNIHTNPEHKKLTDMTNRANEMKVKADSLSCKLDRKNNELAETNNAFREQLGEVQKLKAELAAKETEIMKLKAKLYDMMTKEEG